MSIPCAGISRRTSGQRGRGLRFPLSQPENPHAAGVGRHRGTRPRCRVRRRAPGSRLLRALMLCLLPLAVLLMGCGGSDLKFPTEYQAVFLDNGQVFFGRLTDASSPFLMLKDVYYIRTLTEPDKKETKHLLVKRGAEWHAPDFMRINARHVVLIEPVAPDSRVAQLIRAARTHPAGLPPTAAPAPQAPAVKPPAATPKKNKKGPGHK